MLSCRRKQIKRLQYEENWFSFVWLGIIALIFAVIVEMYMNHNHGPQPTMDHTQIIYFEKERNDVK